MSNGKCNNTAAFAPSLALGAASAHGLTQLQRTHTPLSTRHSARRQARRGATRHATAPACMAGMPKVPYKAPGAQNHEFIDIFNRLYRERIIYVGQDLDDEQANQIIAVLLYLENDDAKANVSLYFNCPGGTVPAGLAVYDCLVAMKYPVVTINLGLAASMSAFLVGAGTKGKRMALPNSRFLLQSPSLLEPVRGQASDVQIEVQNILRQRERIIDGLHAFTGRSRDVLRKDLARDMYLTAPEARTYGLIDQVLMPSVKGPSERFVAGLGTAEIGVGFNSDQ